MTPLAGERSRTWLGAGFFALLLGLGVLGGLAGGLGMNALRTGRVDPLDWAASMFAGLALPAAWLLWRRVAPQPVLLVLLMLATAAPVLLLTGVAAARWVWLPALAFAMLMVGGVLLLGTFMAIRSGQKARGLLPAGIIAMMGATLLPLSSPAPDVAPLDVLSFSALPLHGARAPTTVSGLRAPIRPGALDVAMIPGVRLIPIDSLNDPAASRHSVMLLAQPRPLAPSELVALDHWVREGGRVVILADPDLLWEGRFPLGHPLAPPRSSTLTPLLRHWGVMLAVAAIPNDGDPVARRVLKGGAMIQTGRVGRLQLKGGTNMARCQIADEGFTARCVVGNGEAQVVADADWINPDLWTLADEDAQQRQSWTSDAPDVLSAWFRGEPAGAQRRGAAFMSGLDGLIMGLRLAGLLALSLAVVAYVMIRKWSRVSEQENARR
jgi:hypothetical protein